jgi:hypothetical protein
MQNFHKRQPHLFALLCHFGLQYSRKSEIRLFFYFRWIPELQAFNFCWLKVTNQVLILPKQDREPVLDHSYMLSVKILSPVSHESRWFLLNQSFFFFHTPGSCDLVRSIFLYRFVLPFGEKDRRNKNQIWFLGKSSQGSCDYCSSSTKFALP